MAMPVFAPGDDPGSSFPELLRRIGAPAPSTCRRRRRRARRRAARHHVRRPALRRRRGHGRRPPGHGRQPDQPPGDGEGRRGRPPQRRRHRRRRRPGDGDGQAVPAAARALREGRGRRPQPRGQGQPAVDDDPRQPAGGDDGPRRRADLRRLRPAPRSVGRLWAYDVTGGRYEEREYVATGSGSLHAGTVDQARLPRRASTATTAVDLACRALWEAADADSATGGPDALRGIYPIVATITADGLASGVADDELADALRGDRRAATDAGPHA